MTIKVTGRLFKPADAVLAAAAAQANDEDGWKYIPVHDPKGTGWSFVKIYDENGEFIGKLF